MITRGADESALRRKSGPRLGASKRITVVLPFLAMTGGTQVLVEYANALHRSGHRVTLVYPWYHLPPVSARARVKGWVKAMANQVGRATGTREIRWARVLPPMRAVRALADAYLPDADLLVATEHHTVRALDGVSPSKGVKVHFVQHYETWVAPAEEVDATLRSPRWRRVVVATWLKELLRERFGGSAEVVLNGVDLRTFHPAGRSAWGDPPRVLTLYHPVDIKGTRDAVAAFLRVREMGVPMVPVFFGAANPGDELLPLGDVEFHRFPRGERLRRLYAGADVFVFPSRVEGFGLTPLEAMACGAALVATRCGGVPDFAIPDVTARVVPPGDPAALADALAGLLQDPARAQALGAAGARHARAFPMEAAAGAFEAALMRALDEAGSHA